MPGRTALKDLLYEHTMAAAPELVRHEDDGSLRCLSCGNRCRIPEGQSGICKVRFNRNGELRVPYGYVAGVQADPIEKKPFFHALPGRDALSFGMLGCNLYCAFCQNWVSSQALRDPHAGAYPRFIEPGEVVDIAVSRGAPVIVSTYNEPLITSDWAVEVFRLAREKNLRCGYVSNGNATPEVLAFIRPYVDLLNVDLKAFDEDRYRELGCRCGNVLDSIRQMHAMGFWIEVVTLIMPDFNDSDEELRGMAEFIASLSVDIPWHVTAYHPDYKDEDGRATTPEDLERAYTAGRDAGLRYIYAGNLPGAVGDTENTHCWSCNALLIRRHGFRVVENRMAGANCPDCGASIGGVWEERPPVSGRGIPRRILRG